MPLETKEILDYLGIKEDVKSLDELKPKFEKEFVRAANITEDSEYVKPILGKVYGTLENEIKKVVKDHGLELDFESEDFKGKKVTDKLKSAFVKYDEKKGATIKDLETKAAQGNDEKVKDWESKYEKLKSKHDETQGLLKKTSEDFEGLKVSKEKEVKSIKLDIKKNDIFSKAKFLPTASDYEKIGFITKFNENFSIDLDETEKPIIVTKDGKRIPNPKVSGTFYEPEDLLKEELVKAKLFPLNADAGKATHVVTPQQQQQQTTNSAQRQVAPRM